MIWKTAHITPTSTIQCSCPPGIDQFGASPVGFGKQGFVVLEMYIKDQRGVFNNFVYFPFDKMDDGIQLSDRIVFMRQDDEGSVLLQPEA